MDDNPEVKASVSPGSAGTTQREAPVLRILALAKLAPGADLPPVAVDKNTFSELLARLAPRVSARVTDHLGGGAREATGELAFSTLSSFAPDAVASAVAPLAELLQARRMIGDALRGDLPVAELAIRLPALLGDSGLDRSPASTSPPPLQRPNAMPAPAPSGSIDALLAQVDLPPGTATPLASASLVDVLAAAVAPVSGTSAAQRASLTGALAEIDARLTRQTAAFSELKSIRDLESAWRGLKFLVDRIDFRRPITLEVLPTSRDGFLDDFYHKVFKPEYDGLTAQPLTLVIADFAFDRSPVDLEALQNAARMAESLRVPFVVSVGPEFFGVRQPGLLATLPDLVQKMRSQEYAKWNNFRRQDAALWIAMTANRMLLRDAWGSEGAACTAFDWDPRGGPAGAQPLWGSAVWALAAAVAQAFAADGPRFPITGSQPPALLEDLPLRQYRPGKGEPIPFPLEVMLSEKRAWELAECGFAPLVAAAGRDAAYFASTPTFSAPHRYDQEAATRASYLAATLPYQLFAGVAGAQVQRIGREVRPDMAPEQVRAEFARRMLAFLAECDERPEEGEVTVEVTPSPDVPLALEVMVRLRPRFKICGGDVDLVLGTVVAG